MQFESNIPGAPIPVNFTAAHGPSSFTSSSAGMLHILNLFHNFDFSRLSKNTDIELNNLAKIFDFLVRVVIFNLACP